MSRFINTLLIASVFIGIPFASNLQAGESTGYRRLLDVGCVLHDGTCFVLLEGASVGGTYQCANTQIRWDAKATMGKEHLSMMLMTLKSNGKANFYVSGCYGQSQWPTFDWAHYQ